MLPALHLLHCSQLLQTPIPTLTIEDLNAAGIMRAGGQVREAFGAQLRYAKIKYNSLANYMAWLAAQPQ